MARQNASHEHSPSSCVVCGLSDARALVTGKVIGGEVIALCGNHDLMLRRSERAMGSVAELKDYFADRRSMDRRADGVADELAANLASAFVRERRVADRRS